LMDYMSPRVVAALCRLDGEKSAEVERGIRKHHEKPCKAHRSGLLESGWSEEETGQKADGKIYL
jgi:hypothetical protein